MGKIAEQKISTRRFCRYFVHAPLCVGEAFHGFEPTSILVDGPGEDIEFEGAFHKYKERRIRYQPEVAPVELLAASPWSLWKPQFRNASELGSASLLLTWYTLECSSSVMAIILRRDEDHNTLGANHEKELEGVGVAVKAK